MKASELRPGQIEQIKRALKCARNALEKGVEVRMMDQWPILEQVIPQAIREVKAAMEIVAGWDDEPTSEMLIQEMRTSALKDRDEAKALITQLQDNRALVKGRFYRTRFGVMECKSSDPLKAFDDPQIESMGDVFEEVPAPIAEVGANVECIKVAYKHEPAPSTPEPPFKDGSTVQCISVAPAVNLRGELVDVCRCTPPYTYVVEKCVNSPVGWIVSIMGELHEAKHFVLKDTSTPEPFRAGDWVVCVHPGESWDEQIGKVFEVCYTDEYWVGFGKPTPQWKASRFRHATAAEIAAQEQPLQLAEGKYYERRDGEVVGPAVHDSTGNWPWRIGDFYYDNDGTFSPEPQSIDLIREVPPPVSEPEWPPELVAQLEAESVTPKPLQLHIDDKWLQKMADKEDGKCVSAGGWVADVQKREAEADGWIEWHGGECPVDRLATVDLRFVDGYVLKNRLAEDYDWTWETEEPECNIVAYRVVTPEPPAPKQYRPFASAAEFAIYRDRWINCKPDSGVRVDGYTNIGASVCGEFLTWQELFERFEFEGGEPCGIEVTE